MKGCGKCKWNLKSLFYQCTLQLIPLRLFRRLCDPIHLFWIFLSQLNLWSPLCKISKDWLTFFPKLFSVWSSMSLNNRTCNRHLFISSMLDALYSKYNCIHPNKILHIRPAYLAFFLRMRVVFWFLVLFDLLANSQMKLWWRWNEKFSSCFNASVSTHGYKRT